MRYPFECSECGVEFVVVGSITVGPPTNPPCPECSGTGARVWTSPEVVDRDKPFDWTRRGLNIAEGVRTPAQQERHYQKVFAEEKATALRAKRERGLSRKGSDTMRHAFSIPREAYQARQLQFGKHYWQNEGKRALKRDGFLFED